MADFGGKPLFFSIGVAAYCEDDTALTFPARTDLFQNPYTRPIET